MSGELMLQLFMLAGMIFGYFKLQKEHANQIEATTVQADIERKALKSEMEKAREVDQSENQRLIRDTLAAERAENVRKDRAMEQLAQDVARHAELRAAAETKAEERDRQIIVIERQLGQTIDKALNEAKTATEERVRREMLETQNKVLESERDELRERVSELEIQVKAIPDMEKEISELRKQVEQLIKEKERLAAQVEAA